MAWYASKLHVSLCAANSGCISVALFVRFVWRWDIAQSDISRNVYTISCSPERRSRQWQRIGMFCHRYLGQNWFIVMKVVSSWAASMYVHRLWLSLITLIVYHTAACTCPGESHPGPVKADGSYVGRSAPEIDVFEALIDADGGKVCHAFMILDCFELFHRCLCQLNGLRIMSVLSTSTNLSSPWLYVSGRVHMAEHKQQFDYIRHRKDRTEPVQGRCVQFFLFLFW